MKCPSTAELFEQPELAESPHVLRCPRCEARLRGLEEFLRPAEAPSQVSPDEVERELRQRLTNDIRSAVRTDARRRPRLSAPTRTRSLLLTGTAAAALVFLFWWTPFTGQETPTTRSSSDAESPRLILSERSSWSGSVLDLEWNAVPGAETYQIIVYDAQLRELLHQDATGSERWEFTLEARDGSAVWVRVRALRAGSLVLESELVAISPR